MNTTTETQTRWDLATATKYAEHIKRELTGLCEKIDIAGSIRRGRPDCGDIDLVALVKPGMRDMLEKRVRASANTRVIKNGPQIMCFILWNGMQVDLFFALPESVDMFSTTPGNYGMRLLAMTGSKEHNILLAKRAKGMGIHFHPYKGLMRGGKYVTVKGADDVQEHEEYIGGEVFCGETEEAIFAALGLAFVPPEKREI